MIYQTLFFSQGHVNISSTGKSLQSYKWDFFEPYILHILYSSSQIDSKIDKRQTLRVVFLIKSVKLSNISLTEFIL